MTTAHLDFTELDCRIGIYAALVVFISEAAYAPFPRNGISSTKITVGAHS